MKSMKRLTIVLVFLTMLVALAAPTLANGGPIPERQAPGWQELAPPTGSPPARASHAMAYDVNRGLAVLFGGYSSDGVVLGDTWEFSSATGEWIARSSSSASPPPRMWHVMVYDEARQVTVLFGGYDIDTNTSYNDTWTWNGEEWIELSPASPPPFRRLASATYDAQRQVVVLFGGYDVGYKNDTFEWDGTDWQWVSSDGPSPRGGAAMAYDHRRHVHVLFGGLDLFTIYKDTWELPSGGSWQEVTPPQGPPRLERGGAVYLPQARRVFLFGGLGFIFLDSIFVWNGQVWATREFNPSPGGRCCLALVYDPVLRGVLLFGGSLNGAANNETWLFR